MVFKIGHRGACGYEPENTLLSFKKALELKVDMVECDVHVCKTKQVVVIHDTTVERTTNGSGKVKEKALEQLKFLDAGKGEKIPTLEEVLDTVNCKAKVNIELKGEGTAKPVYQIIEKYIKTKRWAYQDFLISSFNVSQLQQFYQFNRRVKIGVLIDGDPKGFDKWTEKVKAGSIHVRLPFVTRDFIQAAHKFGLKVFVWTVNDSKAIRKMKSMGVDGIFSDFPDRLIER